MTNSAPNLRFLRFFQTPRSGWLTMPPLKSLGAPRPTNLLLLPDNYQPVYARCDHWNHLRKAHYDGSF